MISLQKACIFYFSGTGNTWWATETFRHELKQVGFESEICSIESPIIQEPGWLESKMSELDLLVIGYPIHGSDIPSIMKKLIAILPNVRQESGKSLRTMIFCTQYMFSGDGAYFYIKIFEEKGYTVLWTVHLMMPNNICVPKSPFQYTNDPDKIFGFLRNSRKKIRKICALIPKNTSYYDGKGILGKLGGVLQRYFY